MYAKFFKRILDFTLSICVLIVLTPLLLTLIVLGTVFMGGILSLHRNGQEKMRKYLSLSNSVRWITEGTRMVSCYQMK